MLTPLYPNLAGSAWQLHGLWHAAVTVKLRRFVHLVLAALTQQHQLGRKVELGHYF